MEPYHSIDISSRKKDQRINKIIVNEYERDSDLDDIGKSSDMDDEKENNSDVEDKISSLTVLIGCHVHKQSSCKLQNISLNSEKTIYPYAIENYIHYNDSFKIYLEVDDDSNCKRKNTILVSNYYGKLKKINFGSFEKNYAKRSNKVTCIAIFNEKYFAVGFENGTIRFYERFKNCLGSIYELKQYKYGNSEELPVKDILFNSSGKMFVNLTTKVKIYDINLKSSESIYSICHYENNLQNTIFNKKKSIDFTCIKNGYFHNEQLLISGHKNGDIAFWNMENYAFLKVFKNIESPIKDILISKYHNSFLAISNDKKLYAYEIEDNQPIVYDLPAIPTAFSYSKNENKLIIGYEGFLKLYKFPYFGTEKRVCNFDREDIKLEYSNFERINKYDILLSIISLLSLIGSIEFIFDNIPVSISLLCLSVLLIILQLIIKWRKRDII